MNIRHPKTTGEARAVAAAHESGVAVRSKRNCKHLPNEWDDKPTNKNRSNRYKNKR
jgi:hypothetical protein